MTHGKLSEEAVKRLPIPDTGNRITYFAGATIQRGLFILGRPTLLEGQMTWEWNRTTHTVVLIILIAPWVIALGFALWRNYRRHGLMHTLRRIVKGISIGP